MQTVDNLLKELTAGMNTREPGIDTLYPPRNTTMAVRKAAGPPH
jgi:hypothetical protein